MPLLLTGERFPIRYRGVKITPTAIDILAVLDPAEHGVPAPANPDGLHDARGRAPPRAAPELFRPIPRRWVSR
jgi:hypothetical protein